MRKFLAAMLCLGLLCGPVRAEETEKYVALTFDDGPSGRFTRKLLAGLEERDTKATFLLCGYRIAQAPELTRQILESGHEIGLHGYSHKSMDRLCAGELEAEIDKTLAQLPEDMAPAFLRPPGGCTNSTVCAIAKEKGLAILCWSVDPRDWANHDAAAVERSVISHVKDGDVILLHDMSESSVDAALVIVDTLKEQGFTFVTVSELAELRGVTPEPGKVYSHFPP